MSRLDPEKLHVTFMKGTTPRSPLIPRRYTLTHSDRTGDLFLSIGPAYDKTRISGPLAKLMRDEALGEWKKDNGSPVLHVYCHVSGGLVLGSAGWRDAILRREIPLVLEAIRFGDSRFIQADPRLDRASVMVHFRSSNPKYNRVEKWGLVSDYSIKF